MILIDRQIAELCQGIVPEDIQAFYSNLGIDLPGKIRPMVEEFDPELVNPASLDIRIGETAKLRLSEGYDDKDLTRYSENKPGWIRPGDRLLVASLETFNLPNFVQAKFYLKSSRGREWYESIHAGLCDPGWHDSRLTMELVNMDLAPLPIFSGFKIGQLEFTLTFGLPERSYALTGRYNGDKTVEASKG